MNFYALLSFAAFIIYLEIGIYGFIKDRKSRINLNFLLLCLIFALYSFCFSFIFFSHSKADVWILYKISSIGWLLFPAFTLNFILALKQKRRMNNWVSLLFFATPVILIIRSFSNGIYASDFTQVQGIWYPLIDTDSAWTKLFLAYLALYLIITLIIIIQWYVKAKTRLEKYQSLTLLIAGSVNIVANVATNVIIPISGTYTLPDMAHFTSLTFVIAVWYAIRKFRLMSIAPNIAMDELFRNIEDFVILVNADHTISRANFHSEKNLGYKPGELQGHPIGVLFKEKYLLEKLKFTRDTPLTLKTELITKNGKTIPVILSLSEIENPAHERIGTIIIGHNIGILLELEAEINKRQVIESRLLMLSKAAIGFVELPISNNIYEYIASQIQEMTADCIICINSFNDACSLATLESWSGLSNQSDSLKKQLLSPLLGNTVPVTEDQICLFQKGRLSLFPGGLSDIPNSIIPKQIVNTLHKLFPVGKVYGACFNQGAKSLGTLTIIAKGSNTLENIDLLDTFINQASIAIDNRRSYQLVHKREGELSLITDNIPIQLAHISKDLNILFINKAFQEWTGLTESEAQGMKLKDLMSTQAYQEIMPYLLEVMKGKKVSFELEITQGKSTSTNRYQLVPQFDGNQGIIAYYMIGEDITERVHSELRSRENEEKLKTIFNILPIGITITNMQNQILEFNPALSKILSLSSEAIINGQYAKRSYFHTDGSPMSQEEYPSTIAFKEKRIVRNVEIGVLKENGDMIWVNTSSAPIPLEGYGVVITTSDITDFKKFQNELQSKRSELENLNNALEEKIHYSVEEIRKKDEFILVQARQAAMGEMISNIAHQWRQPLNALGIIIQNYNTYYRQGLVDEDFVQKAEERGMRLITHMSQTIDAFKNFFKPNKERVKFSIQKILITTLNIIEAGFQNHQIDLKFQAVKDFEIVGFPNEFSQVILNLLNNAKDALINQNTQDPSVLILLYEQNGCVIIKITDNGGGVPESIQNKLFEPYFTTKPSGTGIGLYMSKNIIEKHMHGKIYYTYNGSGSTFTIELQEGAITEGKGY